MSEDISDIITNLILQEDEELAFRLEVQDMALRETRCIDPRVGKWVDEYDLEYLFATLGLGDEDFGIHFPEMKHVTRREREQLASIIRGHVSQCPHCSLKQGYDLEWAGRIKRVCQEHRQFLLEKMQEEESSESDAQEGEHGSSATLKKSTATG